MQEAEGARIGKVEAWIQCLILQHRCPVRGRFFLDLLHPLLDEQKTLLQGVGQIRSDECLKCLIRGKYRVLLPFILCYLEHHYLPASQKAELCEAEKPPHFKWHTPREFTL